MGYSFRFFLILRKLPYVEELDGVLRPCRSPTLDGKDQRHLFCHGGCRLYGQGLATCRSQLPLADSESTATPLLAAPGGSAGKYLPGPDFLRLFCSVDGSTDG